ncbi:hypothetical protein [Sphingobacterium sp. MYb382]|uniref:hypothetical protein n=1 Tax=Sphingobacterium sp. MYb382 TaxID=2745278 RepID=UPI0030978FA3
MRKEEDYIILQINGFVNIEERAHRYAILPEELVEFHNLHCGLADLLSLRLPKYIEYLYVPRVNYEKQQATLVSTTDLYLPRDESVNVYGVIINFLPKGTEIDYTMKVERLYKNVELTKYQTFVNRCEVDLQIEQFYEQAGKSLYPLELLINQDGSIARMASGEESKKRWKEEYRPQFLRLYKSELADEMIKELDDVFITLDAKVANLKRSLFYKLFFLPIYRYYPNFELDVKLSFYFSPLAKEILYEVKCRLISTYTETGKMVVSMNGVEVEDIYNAHTEKGTLELVYLLHKDTNEIFSIKAELTALEKGQAYKVVFQLYELKK